jgi:ferredoxin-NADP reductase
MEKEYPVKLLATRQVTPDVMASPINYTGSSPGYLHTRIDRSFLQEQITNFHQPFYICGPDQMVIDLSSTLQELGANPESLVFEK